MDPVTGRIDQADESLAEFGVIVIDVATVELCDKLVKHTLVLPAEPGYKTFSGISGKSPVLVNAYHTVQHLFDRF